MQAKAERADPTSLCVRYNVAVMDKAGTEAAVLESRSVVVALPVGRVPAAADVIACLPRESAVYPEGEWLALGDLPQPIVFCRALDGWAFFATTDREAWRSFCMTFLNQQIFEQFDSASAWRSADVFRVVELALGTYPTEEMLGRCDTFNVPCLTVFDGRNPTEFAVRSGIASWSAQAI